MGTAPSLSIETTGNPLNDEITDVLRIDFVPFAVYGEFPLIHHHFIHQTFYPPQIPSNNVSTSTDEYPVNLLNA